MYENWHLTDLGLDETKIGVRCLRCRRCVGEASSYVYYGDDRGGAAACLDCIARIVAEEERDGSRVGAGVPRRDARRTPAPTRPKRKRRF